MTRSKRFELIGFIVYPILASWLSFVTNANVLFSTFFFLIIPSIYLSIRLPKLIKKASFFAVVAGVTISILVDYVGQLTKSWAVPYTFFSYRLFGIVSLDIIIWGFFYFYFIVMFYEYFYDSEQKSRLYFPKFIYFTLIILILSAIFLFLVAFDSSSLYINYFYLKVGIAIAIIPIMLVLLRFPVLAKKFIKTTLYFALLTIIYEITALKLGQWVFYQDGKFLARINVLGVMFPVEELAFFILLGAMAVLSYYEYFDDDRR